MVSEGRDGGEGVTSNSSAMLPFQLVYLLILSHILEGSLSACLWTSWPWLLVDRRSGLSFILRTVSLAESMHG